MSARIINPLNKVIECYCIWRTIEINGKIRDDVKQYITSHSTRVSWSGGDTNGATEGIKHIDDEGILNIATPTNAGLKFETAKGGREFGLDKDYGKGEYKIGFELKYRPLGEGEFQSKLFDVNFSCWIEPRRIVRVFSEGDDKFEDVDIIICEVGPQLFTGNNQVLCLYLKIIREED
ncbi:hypothetical protein DIM_11880 [Candidatus Denitrolinea symbiosum]|nr:hypothetical protein DIM_11880 [Candidatus Denitrolinea symbiosum]